MKKITVIALCFAILLSSFSVVTYAIEFPDVAQKTTSFFKDLSDKFDRFICDIVRKIEGETVIESDIVTMSFPKKAFDESKDYSLWVTKIALHEAGIAPAGYSDYVVAPKDGYEEPVVISVALLDSEGNAYSASKRKFHDIRMSIDLPDSWKYNEKIVFISYEWSDTLGRHIKTSDERPMTDKVELIKGK